MTPSRLNRFRKPLIWALLCGATLAAYFPVLRAGFIWNDADYVTKPALQSVAGLKRILFEVGATEQYYPVLHGAFWVEHRLWGDSPLGYHLLNVLLHGTAAFLFGLVLCRMLALRPAQGGAPDRRPGAWIAALIFALHPVCVESVAWVAEEKNTLSTVFYLLALLAYLRFDEKWNALGARVPPAEGATSFYFLSFALFVAAILSKSVTATFPGALLVIAWWQRGRLEWRRDVRPALPFFAVGAAWGLFSAWVERTYVGAQGAEFGLSFLQRALLAGHISWFYLAKLFWPAHSIFIYPRWTISAAAPGQYVYPVALLALVAILWRVRGRSRAPLAALLFFLGSLFPLSGLFNVYGFIFSYVADHWEYLPALGVIALAAGALRQARGDSPARIAGGRIAGVAVACFLGVLTWRQTSLYRDIQSFYELTLARNPGAWMAHTNLGLILADEGRPAEAAAHYEAALRLDPYRPEIVHNALGTALVQMGRVPAAEEQFQAALQLDPRYADAHRNLGGAYLGQRRLREASEHLAEAVREEPGDVGARNNLGIALAQMGRVSEAAAQFREAVRLDPRYQRAWVNLGSALAAEGRLPEAAAELRRAIRLDPANAEAHFNLGLALTRQGQLAEARGEFEQALRLKPDYAAARQRLAELPAGAGD